MSINSSESDDEALVAHVQQRDLAAFTQLYDRYARTVYTLAVHMLGRMEAEEIVQDVFLQLWNKASRFDPTEGSFLSWFMTMARRRILDRLKHFTRQERATISGELEQILENVSDKSVNIEEEAWLMERGEAVRQALKELPEEQRQVLLLAYFGGLSHSAIAEQLQWPLGTVKKRIQLGLRKLRTLLYPHEIIETTNRDDYEL